MSSPTRGKEYNEFYWHTGRGRSMCSGGQTEGEESVTPYFKWLIQGQSLDDRKGPGDRSNHLVLVTTDELEQILDFWGR